jgi:hypothetical protein
MYKTQYHAFEIVHLIFSVSTFREVNSPRNVYEQINQVLSAKCRVKIPVSNCHILKTLFIQLLEIYTWDKNKIVPD